MKHNGRTAFTFAAALMAALALHSASAAPQAPGRLDGYFSQGVDLYRQKDYPGALAAFLKAQDEAKTGPLFYNLGNCYLKTGSLGQAILYYERALESMPGDPDVLHNIAYARSLLKDNIVPRKAGFIRQLCDGMAARFTAKGLVLFSLAVFGAALALTAVFYILWPNHRIAASVLLSCCVVAWGLTAQGALAGKRAPRGVVTAPVAEARFGPGETVAFELHEGTMVHVLREQDGWSLIRLEDGKTGYVSRDSLAPVF